MKMLIKQLCVYPTSMLRMACVLLQLNTQSHEFHQVIQSLDILFAVELRLLMQSRLVHAQQSLQVCIQNLKSHDKCSRTQLHAV